MELASLIEIGSEYDRGLGSNSTTTVDNPAYGEQKRVVMAGRTIAIAADKAALQL